MGRKTGYIVVVLLLAVGALVALSARRKAKPYLVLTGQVFGTYYNIRYQSSQDLESEVVVRLEAVNRSLSMFNPQSVISRINRNEDMTADSLFTEVFTEALRVYRLSGGAFDITVAPLVNRWGFGISARDSMAVPQSDIDSLLRLVGMDKVSLTDGTIVKADSRISLDASAIAKGYACDRVARLLDSHGCINYLVDIGGEVVAKGMNDKGAKWRIGITRPDDGAGLDEQELQDVIETDNTAMATSGNYRRFYYAGGEKRSHTIDPRTGRPVQHNLLSATVVAPTCMQADALATACMVLGEKEALALMDRCGDAACYLIVARGDTMVTVRSDRWETMAKMQNSLQN